MKKFFVLIIAMLLFTSACVARKGQPMPTESPEPIPEQGVRIEAVLENPFGDEWNVIGEVEHDVISGGEPETITLVTTAQQEKGQWLFDDSQDWGLAVETAAGTYALFREHCHGMVYMDVSEFYQGDETVPVISLYMFSGAGTQIRQYTYQDGAFTEHTIYTTADQADGGINRIYSTVPSYY